MYSIIMVYEEEEDGQTYWVAWHPELDLVSGDRRIQRCLATGDTIAEAQAELKSVCQAFLRALREDGLPIPVPYEPPNVTIFFTVDAAQRQQLGI